MHFGLLTRDLVIFSLFVVFTKLHKAASRSALYAQQHRIRHFHGLGVTHASCDAFFSDNESMRRQEQR